MKFRALAVAGVLALGAPATAAADPGPEPPQITPKTAAGSSPKLDPGKYRFTLPTDDSTRYVQVSRKAAEQLTVAGFAVPKAEADSIKLSLTLPDGDTDCDTDLESVDSSDVRTPLLPQVQSPGSGRGDDTTASDEKCETATDFLVKIERTDEYGSEDDDSDETPLPVELTVTREPKATGDKGSPAKGKDLEPSPLPVKDDEDVKPGRTPATAAPLDSDTGTKVSVTPGTGAYYKVRVGWNQRLDAAAQVPANGSGYKPQTDLRFTLNILGPHGVLARAGGENTGSVYEDMDADPQQLTASTPPVRWANRQLDDDSSGSSASSSVDTDSAAWASQAGWYVVYLRVSPDSDADQPEDPKPVPALLTVKTSGTAGAGPTFTSGEHQLAAPAAGHLSGPGQASSSMLGTALKIGLSVVVVVLAVGAVLWARRRRAT